MPRASNAAIDQRQLWLAWANDEVSDDDAQAAAEAAQLGGISPKVTFKPALAAFSVRRPQRSPDRQRSIERRRMLAASGPMPPALAAKFTVSEQAVLKIVGDEHRHHGFCERSVPAERLGLVHVEYRPLAPCRHDTNMVTAIDAAWSLAHCSIGSSSCWC